MTKTDKISELKLIRNLIKSMKWMRDVVEFDPEYFDMLIKRIDNLIDNPTVEYFEDAYNEIFSIAFILIEDSNAVCTKFIKQMIEDESKQKPYSSMSASSYVIRKEWN